MGGVVRGKSLFSKSIFQFFFLSFFYKTIKLELDWKLHGCGKNLDILHFG